MSDNKKAIYVSKKVNNLYRSYKKRRIILIVVIVLFAMNLALYSGLTMAGTDESVKVHVKDGSQKSLILSSNDFKTSSPILYAKAPENITNITYANLPLGELNSILGSHNGRNYIAYTFEIKNNGKEKLSYNQVLAIEETSKGVEEAVRVMVYQNNIAKIYAKPVLGTETSENVSDMNLEKTIQFHSQTEIFDDIVSDFDVGSINRYTIVIWLEGSDPDCIDDVVGGEFKVSFSFSVVEE